MNSKIVLLRAQTIHKAFLLTLRKKTMVQHLEKAGLNLSEQQHIESVDENFRYAYLIQHNKQTIGMIKYHATENRLEIFQFQILPKYQGKGFGKSVLNTLKTTANNKPLHLSVLKTNPAKQLYERFGFKVIDEDQYEFHMTLSNNKEVK